MSDDSESKKGEELEAKGDKEKTKWKVMNPNKFENACEFYEKSAKQYALNRKWKQSADVGKKAADVYRLELKDHSSAARALHTAAEAYKNANDPAAALTIFRQTAQMMFEVERPNEAAKCWMEVAKLEEKEGKFDKAIEAWEFAAKNHTAGNSSALAVTDRLNVARLLSLSGDLGRAAALWERIASSECESELTKWSCVDYWFKAAICHLVTEVKFKGPCECVDTLEAVTGYISQYPAFETSRECKFIRQLAEQIASPEKDQIAQFTNIIAKWNAISALDPWTAKQLMAIKRKLENPDHDEPSAAAALAGGGEAKRAAGAASPSGGGAGAGTAGAGAPAKRPPAKKDVLDELA